MRVSFEAIYMQVHSYTLKKICLLNTENEIKNVDDSSCTRQIFVAFVTLGLLLKGNGPTHDIFVPGFGYIKCLLVNLTLMCQQC